MLTDLTNMLAMLDVLLASRAQHRPLFLAFVSPSLDMQDEQAEVQHRRNQHGKERIQSHDFARSVVMAALHNEENV